MAKETRGDETIKDRLRNEVIKYFRGLDQKKHPDGVDYDDIHGQFLKYQSWYIDAVLHDLLDEEFLVHGMKYTNLKLNHVENVE